MRLARLCLILLPWPCILVAQTSLNPVQQAIFEGDLYQSKHRYVLAFDAYRKADKLSNHSSAEAFLKLSLMDRKFGNFPLAMEDAKRAFNFAGTNKSIAVAALFQRASLLSDSASKSDDKKLHEAEGTLRQALLLDPSNGLLRYYLGFVLLKQGRDAEGTAELKTYLDGTSASAQYTAEARRMIDNPVRAREPFSPDFSFVSNDSQKISNESMRGKVVLLDFWNTWCCRATLPTIKKLRQEYEGKAVELISISSDDDEEVWRTFVESEHLSWPQYLDRSHEVSESFHVETFPTYIVLDKDGVMRYHKVGSFPSYEVLASNGRVLFDQARQWVAFQKELEEAINKELKRPPNPKLAKAGSFEGSK